ncbi:DUF5801 repeats-in-toxin domain-containing protein, partial [Bradyrhizobium macuxiense]|uniref:T1SS-143 repeat domain-containing protein n=1 Tax=Bradyrhizobium macuxiense TaxID=1755647 RepID=UPI001ABF84D2
AATASKTVFTFALTEATGAYTFTLSAPIDQDGPGTSASEGVFSFSSISSLLTATDKDGSSTTAASGALTLAIIDDQPAASTNKEAQTVDEDGLSSNALSDTASASVTSSITSLFTPGADAPIGKYTLSGSTSGLPALTSGGVKVNYSITSDGTTDTLTATKTGGGTVFTLALTEASGAYTFTLSAPVDQIPGATDSSQTTIDFSSIVQATDADGSTANAAAKAWTVTVIDDVPANLFPEAIVNADNVQDAAGSTFTGNLVNTVASDGNVDPNPSLTIDQHAGADGFGALTFTGTNGAQLSGQIGGSTQNLKANGNNIYLFGFGTGTLTATTDSTGAGLPGGASGSPVTADEVFTIALNHTSGQYAFNMLQPISNGANFTFSDFADVPAGDYAWFSLPFNPTTKQPVTPGKSVVFTGLSPGGDTVNPSNIGVGSDKQAVAPGKAIRLDFVDNVHSITTTTDLKSLATLGYLDHYEVNNAGFTLSQVNPNGKTVDVRLDAYEVPEATPLSPGGTFPTDASATHEAVTEVKIVTEDSSGNVTAVLADFTGGDTTKTFTNGGVSQTVEAKFAPSGDTNGVDMIGLQQVPGEFILVSTATGFDRLLATNIGSVYSNKGTFDMGAVSVSTFNVGQPVNMSFNLALQDSDAFNSGLNTNLAEAGTGTLNINLTAPTHA